MLWPQMYTGAVSANQGKWSPYEFVFLFSTFVLQIIPKHSAKVQSPLYYTYSFVGQYFGNNIAG